MRPHVLVRLEDGQTRTLGPGDLVGRAWSAALYLDDPRISEAHALVSLRGQALRLLALRGRFAVDGRVIGELDLAVGQRVMFAPDLGVEVLDVVLPDEMFALEGEGLASTALHGAAGLVLRPVPALVHAADASAVAWLWLGPSGWRLRRADGASVGVEVGEAFVVEGRAFRVVRVALRPLVSTALDGGLRAPLRLLVRYETVHIFRADADPVVIDGVQARLLSELVAFDAPVAWGLLAGSLWPGEGDPVLLRKRLDGALSRLRSNLRGAGVRADLVRNNGQGQFELLLAEGDSVEDQL